MGRNGASLISLRVLPMGRNGASLISLRVLPMGRNGAYLEGGRLPLSAKQSQMDLRALNIVMANLTVFLY